MSPHSDEIMVDSPSHCEEHLQQDSDIPVDIFGMRGDPFIEQPRQSRPSEDPTTSRNNVQTQSRSSEDPTTSRNNVQTQTRKDNRSALAKSRQSYDTHGLRQARDPEGDHSSLCKPERLASRTTS